MERTIKLERLLLYPPDMVWKAITDARTLGSWFMEGDIEPKLHHEFMFRRPPQRGWDGLTYCEVIELESEQRIAYTYRGKASGEKTLACAGIHSDAADTVGKNIFTELDTVLRFTLTPDATCDGKIQTHLTLEHSGFKGFQLMVVSLVMGYGWSKLLRKLPIVLEAMSGGETAVNLTSPQAASK